MPLYLQTSFAGGELAPALAGRLDLAKYRVGAQTMENFFVRAHGDASVRQGTLLAGEAPGTGRLLPFQFSVEQSYVLEFTDQLMRVYRNGSLVPTPYGGFQAPLGWWETGTAGEYALASGVTEISEGTVVGGTTEFLWETEGASPEFALKRWSSGGGYASPGLSEPEDVRHLGNVLPQGTRGSLPVTGGWAWAVDSNGYNTIFVRLPDDADPRETGSYGMLAFDAGANPGLTSAEGWTLRGVPELVEGTAGSLAEGEWATGVFNGFSTVVLRLPGSVDPNTLAPWDLGPVVEVVSPYAAADLRELKFTQSADVVYLSHPNYPLYKLSRTAHHTWSFAQVQYEPTIAAPTNLAATPGAAGRTTWYYRVSGAEEVLEDLLPEGAPDGFYENYLNIGNRSTEIAVSVPSSFTGGVTVMVGPTNSPSGKRLVERKKGTGAWNPIALLPESTGYVSDTNLSTLSTGTIRTGYLYSLPTVDAEWGTTSSTDYTYVVTQVINGEESLPSDEVISEVTYPWPSGTRVILTWSGTTGADSVRIYKNSRGEWGIIGEVEGGTESFTDDNITPDPSEAPPSSVIANLDEENGYPGACGLFEQRLILARSNDAPQTVWAGTTGQFDNFMGRVQLLPTDAFEATIATGLVTEIRHIVPLQQLILLTSSSEWSMGPNASGEAMSGSNVAFKLQGYRGCNETKPLVIGNNCLFVSRDGTSVRDLFFRFEDDGYVGSDLTILSRHIFEQSGIKEWAYQQSPDGIVWVVKEDGSLAGFTYLREHEVWAWHQHTTDGTAVSVASIQDADGKDDVYFLVARTIDGTIRYFVERLSEWTSDKDEAVFSDCARVLTADSDGEVTGLSHLEGETVAVLVDGAPLSPRTVSGGAINVGQAAARVVVGLPYVAKLAPMPMSVQTRDGVSFGKMANAGDVVVRVRESFSFKVGPTFDAADLSVVPIREHEKYDQATNSVTGDLATPMTSQTTRQPTVCIQVDEPLPITVLGLQAEVSVE